LRVGQEARHQRRPRQAVAGRVDIGREGRNGRVGDPHDAGLRAVGIGLIGSRLVQRHRGFVHLGGHDNGWVAAEHKRLFLTASARGLLYFAVCKAPIVKAFGDIGQKIHVRFVGRRTAGQVGTLALGRGGAPIEAP
jgi:hypothetical protein